MALSYAELIAPVSKDDELRTLLELARLAGFPATSWQPGSVPRTLLEIEAEALATKANIVRQIALGGLLEEAEGDWLTLLVASTFQEQRQPAVRTRGLATLTCSPLAGPYTINVGSITAANAGGRMFRNITGGVLPSGGTLQLTFEAEHPGADWNIGANTLNRMLTPLAGVTLNNPDPGTGWITQTGTNEESDEQLRERCKMKWGTIGTGANVDSYKFWARTAHPEVRRVKVLSYSDHGVPTPGHVTLYLAGDSGGVSVDAVQAVRDYIEPRRPLVATVHVESATPRPIAIAATLHVESSKRATAEVQLQGSPGSAGYIQELARSLDIGSTVYLAAIIEQLMRPDGMINATVSSPTTDVTLTFDEVAVLSLAPADVTWIEV